MTDDVLMVEVPLAWISEALDEIYELRQVCAYEALARKADLDYKSYPKSRRAVAEDRIARLQAAARGHSEIATAGTNYQALRSALKEAGAAETMTRSTWEAGKPALQRVLARAEEQRV